MFSKKTVKDINLTNKRVLLRADYNVPVDERGKITDDYRMRESVPTLKYILKQKGVKLVIVSHMGRPKGPQDKKCSLAPVAKHLSSLLDKKVHFAPDCIGEEAKKVADELSDGEILLLENVRFHAEEEKNSAEFAKKIVEATSAQVFVQDGFGVVHRAHATTDAITKLLPSVAGLLLEKEVDAVSRTLEDPAKPLVAVVGGAKVSDKIDVLNKFINLADCVAVAGAMGNNFLLAQGFRLGKSKIEPEALDITREILQRARREEKQRNFSFLTPVDVVVSTNLDGRHSTRIVDLASHSISDIEAYPRKPTPDAYSIKTDEMILDIGPVSASYIAGAVRTANTVIWNGTCGVTEVKGIAGAQDPFAHGTQIVIDAIIGASNVHKNKAFSLVGGGDTVGYVEAEGLTEDFSHVSTGGGATLELLAGKKLPGLEALQNK